MPTPGRAHCIGNGSAMGDERGQSGYVKVSLVRSSGKRVPIPTVRLQCSVAHRSNEEWLRDLHSAETSRDVALADLRAIVLSGLPYALAHWLNPDDPAFGPLAEEVAQNTLMRVLERLDSFEGRSQFTTWVHKIAVRIALTELRRRKWQDVSLEAQIESTPSAEEPHWAADTAAGPETLAERGDLLSRIERMLREELTDRQRQAMTALAIQGLPLEEVARRLGTERNALYKLLHDARIRLKRRLEREGLTPAEALAIFAAK